MGANWLLEAAQEFRQRVETASPLRDPDFDRDDIAERLTLVPDAEPPRLFRCVGCGKNNAKKPRTYCAACARLVSLGIDLETRDIPTERECRRVCGWERNKRKSTNRYTDPEDTNG